MHANTCHNANRLPINVSYQWHGI